MNSDRIRLLGLRGRRALLLAVFTTATILLVKGNDRRAASPIDQRNGDTGLVIRAT